MQKNSKIPSLSKCSGRDGIFLVLLMRGILNHPKIFECFSDCFLFFRRTLWLSGIFGFRQVVVSADFQPTFSFYLGDIKIGNFQAAMLQHILLDLRISCAILKLRHIHIFQRELNPNLFRVDLTLGKQDYRLMVCPPFVI